MKEYILTENDILDPMVNCVVYYRNEVIRCKNCRYYQRGNFTSEEREWCTQHHKYTEKYYFCAWAERKEE